MGTAIKRQTPKPANMRPPSRRGRIAGFFREVKINYPLYIMILPAFAFILIFNYYPLYGLQIAFKQFNVVDGIWSSPFVGLKNFEFYFGSMFFAQTTYNTLLLNFLFITFGVFMQVTTAVLLNEIISRKAQKVFQTSMFFPYFISWIVVSTFITGLLSERFGMVNKILSMFGVEGVSWYTQASVWPAILTIINVWKGLGYGTIIYLAKIVGIDSEIYEAAMIDGANKFQEIINITIPMLRPTIIMLLLIAIGGIFRGDFGMIYSIIGDRGILYPTTEIIDTYVYRAMRLNAQYGMAAAVGLYQSLMGFVLVLLSNFLVRKVDPESAIF